MKLPPLGDGIDAPPELFVALDQALDCAKGLLA
jgi:hypothetical protein